MPKQTQHKDNKDKLVINSTDQLKFNFELNPSQTTVVDFKKVQRSKSRIQFFDHIITTTKSF